MKIIGVILIALGILALVYGGVNYKRDRTVLDVGGIKATATEHRSLPISPIIGGIAIVGGLIMVFSKGRTRGGVL